jgi:hypothetical protein
MGLGRHRECSPNSRIMARRAHRAAESDGTDWRAGIREPRRSSGAVSVRRVLIAGASGAASAFYVGAARRAIARARGGGGRAGAGILYWRTGMRSPAPSPDNASRAYIAFARSTRGGHGMDVRSGCAAGCSGQRSRFRLGASHPRAPPVAARSFDLGEARRASSRSCGRSNRRGQMGQSGSRGGRRRERRTRRLSGRAPRGSPGSARRGPPVGASGAASAFGVGGARLAIARIARGRRTSPAVSRLFGSGDAVAGQRADAGQAGGRAADGDESTGRAGSAAESRGRQTLLGASRRRERV